MYTDTIPSTSVREDLDILLDGSPVRLPPGRHSLSGIRSHLETLALGQQRVLGFLSVDGIPAGRARKVTEPGHFTRVEGRTFALDQIPLQLIRMTMEQVEQARQNVQSAVSLMLINDAAVARELWWDLTKDLKLPLMTLSLLPETLSGAFPGGASATQIRKWQLQQLGELYKDVDGACCAHNAAVLAQALESRVLPWLDNLEASLALLHTTVSAGRSAAEERQGESFASGRPAAFWPSHEP
jgi:hypothetical protein